MPSSRPAFIPAIGDRRTEPDAPCLFEVEHGDTVIRIADDWDGHVLIERLYTALRKARHARDGVGPRGEAESSQENTPAERPAT